MSIPVLIEVYDEMRRLAIAGSAVAAGDFRLKKLVAPLEKSGEKAPVFAKVAQAVNAVVESNEKTASVALLELATLVNAILYTQGETGVAGELKPLEATDLGAHATQAAARTIKPLLETLSSTGSGRIEVVKDAFERGAFKDLRLVKPALGAIDDPYPEIGQFICEKVLPLYGKAIVPELRATLDIKGRGGHVNRLTLLHQLDPDGSRDLIRSALDEGSKEMKVAAIECLGSSEEDLPYLLEQSRAKAKEVRAAALRALSIGGLKAADAVATVKKAIAGPDLELIVDRVKTCPLPEIQKYVLDQSEQQFNELLKLKDKAKQGAAVHRLHRLVLCLEGRADAEAEAFVLKCFGSASAIAAIKSSPSGADLNELVAHVLSLGTPRMQDTLVTSHKLLTGGMISPAMFAARATMSSAAFYDEFHPALEGLSSKRTKKTGDDHDRAQALMSVLTATNVEEERWVYRPWAPEGVQHARRVSDLPGLDPRWLDAAVAARSVELVSQLARPGHVAANKFLLDQVADRKRPDELHFVLRTMVRVNHPDAADVLLGLLKKHAKDAGHYYFSYWFAPLIADLPKSALPKVEELLPSLPEKMVDRLMDAVIALKNKPD